MRVFVETGGGTLRVPVVTVDTHPTDFALHALDLGVRLQQLVGQDLEAVVLYPPFLPLC